MMTARQYKRLRQWDRATQPAYNAGFLDGQEWYSIGYDRPPDPDLDHGPPFDLHFYIRRSKRLLQMLDNHERARERGRVDGWDAAQERHQALEQEDWIEAQVEQGLEQIGTYLKQRAA